MLLTELHYESAFIIISIITHRSLNTHPSRIKKDEDTVQKILSTAEATFIDLLSPLPLISISTGIIATEKVTSDMISVKVIGKEAMDTLIRSRLSVNRTASIFDPIKIRLKHVR